MLPHTLVYKNRYDVIAANLGALFLTIFLYVTDNGIVVFPATCCSVIL